LSQHLVPKNQGTDLAAPAVVARLRRHLSTHGGHRRQRGIFSRASACGTTTTNSRATSAGATKRVRS